ncbi:Uncharacterised protein [Bifidobacterium dentium]|nr:hypothetical protein BBDE_1184 [Bifidobacterium dentium JCM 1195 = DSM 20436]SEB46822.1 hypothetical protein SAMN05192536_0066 [Bifidobacterium dentium JCM 1195 = DSM 20436]VEG23846.1 Uncharacterised protein [Bifidobacterium dentium]
MVDEDLLFFITKSIKRNDIMQFNISIAVLHDVIPFHYEIHKKE